MNLSNITHEKYPFKHWIFNNCLDKDTLDEIHNAALMAVGRKLKSLKFEIPDEFKDVMDQYQ